MLNEAKKKLNQKLRIILFRDLNKTQPIQTQIRFEFFSLMAKWRSNDNLEGLELK